MRTLSSNGISRSPATRTTNDSLTTILRLSNDFRLSTAHPRHRPAPRSHQVLIGNFQDFWRFLGGERSFDISTHGGRLLPRAGVISEAWRVSFVPVEVSPPVDGFGGCSNKNIILYCVEIAPAVGLFFRSARAVSFCFGGVVSGSFCCG